MVDDRHHNTWRARRPHHRIQRHRRTRRWQQNGLATSTLDRPDNLGGNGHVHRGTRRVLPGVDLRSRHLGVVQPLFPRGLLAGKRGPMLTAGDSSRGSIQFFLRWSMLFCFLAARCLRHRFCWVCETFRLSSGVSSLLGQPQLYPLSDPIAAVPLPAKSSPSSSISSAFRG